MDGVRRLRGGEMGARVWGSCGRRNAQHADLAGFGDGSPTSVPSAQSAGSSRGSGAGDPFLDSPWKKCVR